MYSELSQIKANFWWQLVKSMQNYICKNYISRMPQKLWYSMIFEASGFE